MSDRTPKLYLDSNVFISAFEGGDGAERARSLMERIEDGAVVGVTSEITLAEVLVKPLLMKDGGLADVYRATVSSEGTFVVRSVDRTVLERAALLRARHPALKLPDAIHIATASMEACSHLVSGDRSLPTLDAPVAVTLDDHDLSALMERS